MLSRTTRPLASAVLAVVVATAPDGSAGVSTQRHAEEPRQPRSVVLILLDDATARDVDAMQNVQSLVADKGTTFTRNYVPEPYCCPARATILTGLYPHNHRVLDNVAPLGGYTRFDDTHTIATYLDRDYRTGLFGKYLNDNGSQGGYVPPGWDAYDIPARRSTYKFVNPTTWDNGTRRHYYGVESTSLYARHARTFITRSVEAGKPFFAFLPVVTPHRGSPHNDYPAEPSGTTWVPPEYRYTEPRTGVADPSVNEADVSDKPSPISPRPPLTPEQLAAIAERDAQRTESLKAVDLEVARVVDELRALGALRSTYIIVTSDNGYMQGQHRIEYGKGQAYEPATRVPLVIRGPGFAPGADYDRVTGLQDIAPTILSMTHESPTAQVDGVSLLDLTTGRRPTTDRPQLIEIPVTARVSDNAVQAGVKVSRAEARRLTPIRWRARGLVASNGWKYVEYPQTHEAELYNLDADPYELTNLASDPDWADRVAKMSRRLHKWWRCDGDECR